MAAAKLLVAAVSFGATVGKVERFVSTGDLVKPTDPVVKGREDLFRPARPGDAVEER